ncbi:hypothetical protein EP10_002887 [Geobacillus icigianus]|uniref:RDD domain-containing protein n=1 Tax=Geobacillus icigianus TaxID=1430331 RepID=A0ABU6BJ19_9BACL|nr:hypothetical protein B4113_4097 [Geobacillus sp. B4113_201601]MEB3752015.1 hypothetical protein [Geobacillus icigianus]
MNRPAGFWKRLLANLLDAIVIGIPISVIGYLITGSMETNWFTTLANLLYALVVPAVWYGYTVGKRMIGIRIAKVNGGKVGLGTMFLRSFVDRLVYFVTFGMGLIISAMMVAAREDKRSIHDFIARMYVTTEKNDGVTKETSGSQMGACFFLLAELRCGMRTSALTLKKRSLDKTCLCLSVSSRVLRKLAISSRVRFYHIDPVFHSFSH